MARPNPIYTDEHRALVTILRDLRMQKGLRQVDVAEALGRPQAYVSAYERSIKVLDVVEVLRICEALEASFISVMRRFDKAVTSAKG